MHTPTEKCRLCGSTGSSLLQVGVRHAPETEVRRCVACGLVYLSPQPREEELERYYATQYREDYGLTRVAERHRRDLDGAALRVQRLLPRLKPDTRLLEVGSGSGAFLHAVQPYVKEVVGVEPDGATRGWIEEALGFEMREKIPEDESGTAGFDVVVSFHVLEHVPDPVDFLAGLKKILKPGGEVVIEVPNVDDVLVDVYRVPSYLQFYFQKAHLYYFSPATLARALAKAGYQAAISGVQRYDLSNHIRWMLTGQPGGQGYYNDILTPAVQAAYAEALIAAGRSDTLWAVARKAQ